MRQSIQDRYEVEEGEEDYSDADDFIVDDEGRPIAEKRKKRTFFSDSYVIQFLYVYPTVY